MSRILIFCCTLLVSFVACAQNQNHYYDTKQFTEADTLRGMLRPERSCFDVTYYDLQLRVSPTEKTIAGSVGIHFKAVEDFTTLQLDLFENMHISEIIWQKNHNSTHKLPFNRVHNAVFVQFTEKIKKGDNSKIIVHYGGKPTIAKRAPWDGGFVWAKDNNKNDWIGVACEGTGASLWWPNKDHLSDEPDSLRMAITVPRDLVCVANGNLVATNEVNHQEREYVWKVSYPINNYNVTLNIAKYAHFSDTYTSAIDGKTLALDYYVLDYNLQKAKKHFKQVQGVLAAFEKYFNKYPFWNDGFALVETPYLGMEHQSAIAYGNQYMRGYLGNLVPKEFDFDYIIVHETGHEYWGNSISCNDHAEMWIHESFTTYMEALYVEHHYGYEAALRYLESQRPFIISAQPIVGPMDVNWDNWEASDHYYKGSWVLHTLRHAIGDDEKWFGLLRSFYQKNALSNVKTDDFIQYVNQYTNKNWNTFFEQYLFKPELPVLEYKFLKRSRKSCEISYRWRASTQGFSMPISIGKKGKFTTVAPTAEWKTIRLKGVPAKDFSIDEARFLIDFEEVE